MVMSKILPLVRCALNHLVPSCNIFGVDPLAQQIQGRRDRPLELEDSEGFR